jgi:Rrf2 family protein
MKFSSKGRYAIAALIYMAQKNGNEEQITILAISQALGISKIYLEQVFSMLKRAEIVTSTKGAQGGYRLTSPPESLSVGDIARAVETGLFEKNDSGISKEASPIDKAMEALIWDDLDAALSLVLDRVTLQELVNKAGSFAAGQNYMFYI